MLFIIKFCRYWLYKCYPYRKTYNQALLSRDDYLCDIRSLGKPTLDCYYVDNIYEY